MKRPELTPEKLESITETFTSCLAKMTAAFTIIRGQEFSAIAFIQKVHAKMGDLEIDTLENAEQMCTAMLEETVRELLPDLIKEPS